MIEVVLKFVARIQTFTLFLLERGDIGMSSSERILGDGAKSPAPWSPGLKMTGRQRM